MCCGKRPCWPPSVASPVPTISCAGEGGSPTSYIYDDFDRDRGWYNLGTNVEIVSGLMRVLPTAPTSTTATTTLRVLSRMPVSSEEVSMETVMGCRLASAYDNTEFFGIALGGLYVGLGYRAAFAGFIAGVALSSNFYNGSMLYNAASPIADNTTGQVTLKIVATATGARCYINGILVYTYGSPLPVATLGQTLMKPMNAYSGGIQREYATFDNLRYFGYNLPINC